MIGSPSGDGDFAPARIVRRIVDQIAEAALKAKLVARNHGTRISGDQTESYPPDVGGP